MAKVILINPYPYYAQGSNNALLSPPLGLAYLSAELESKNHRVQIIDAHIAQIKPQDIMRHFDFPADLIGIYSSILNYRAAIECAVAIKSHSSSILPIVLGGPFATSLPEMILQKNKSIDAIVNGEGEKTLGEIAESLGKGSMFMDISGVVYKRENDVFYARPAKKVENLDDILPPAYHLLPPLKYYKARSRGFPVGYLVTSRGCPSQCIYCNHNIFGTRWRPHSVERVMSEIDYLVSHCGVRQIDILDDNFTFNRDRTERIISALSSRPYRVLINLQNGIRIDAVDKELLKQMKRAGVFRIGFGIETAVPRIQETIRKPINLEKAVRMMRYAKSIGMVVYGYFMLGLPGDDAESMRETIDFARRANPHFANFSICVPFPGTELFESIKEHGIFLENIENGIEAGFFGNKIFFQLEAMNGQVTSEYFRTAYRTFYARPLKIMETLSTIRSFAEAKWLVRVIGDIYQAIKGSRQKRG